MIDVVFDLLVELRERGRTVLVVEQNARRALEIADRGYVLRTGGSPPRAPAPSSPAHDDLFATYVGAARRGRRRDEFVQTVVDGLGRGSTYALLALGISLIFGVMHLVNFAHAELITVGAYVAYFLSTNDVNWWVLAPAIVIVGGGRLGRHRTDRLPLGARLERVHDAAHVVRPRTALARAVGGVRVADEEVVRRAVVGVQHVRGRRDPHRGDGRRDDRRHRGRARPHRVRVPPHPVRDRRCGPPARTSTPPA